MATETNIKELQKAIKQRERQIKTEQRRRKIKQWLDDNKEIVVIAAPIVITAGVRAIFGISKTIKTEIRLGRENNMKNLRYYDRSLGHYWNLRRPLTNDELTFIDSRKKLGESLADILTELRVLK